MYMDDYVKQLDSVLSSGNRKLLTGSGSVSHKQALEKAKSEYRKYQETSFMARGVSFILSCIMEKALVVQRLE